MSNFPATVHCPTCDKDRRVTGFMGQYRFTLSTCGHVVARDEAAEAKIAAAEARVRAALARQ